LYVLKYYVAFGGLTRANGGVQKEKEDLEEISGELELVDEEDKVP
jgi:hypothetical protein